MSRANETPLDMRRLTELSERADQTGCVMFTPFLTPPEATLAVAAAKRQGVRCVLFGGYDDAERQMACFTMSENEPDFPIDVVKITWRGNEKPDHRSLLGSVTGLGLSRQKLGDIVVQQELAWLFAHSAVSPYVCENLLTAGRTQVSAEISESLPQLEAPAGEEVRDTVLSTRLDALIASGYHLSRSKASALIASGNVKLRYMPTLKPDAAVGEGDVISVRGMGRLILSSVGAPTRKGRLPVTLERLGERK